MFEPYVHTLGGLRTLKMSPVTLQSLSTELLESICEILDITHPISLLAFARTRKRCYAVASNFLFRTTKIKINTEKRPFQDACELEERLRRDDAFGKVRRIILFSGPKEIRYPYMSLHPCERGREDDTAVWRHLAQTLRNWSSLNIHDEEWEPVVRLVEQLTGLSDLFWACRERLPLSLLRVLQGKVKPCRLHHYNFCPRRDFQGSLTSYDRILITSPCLYSLGSLNFGITPSTLKLIRRLQPPGLRRTHFWWAFAEVQAQFHNTENPKSIPREFIEVDGAYFDIPFAVIYNETSGDFSSMRGLKLNVPLAPQGLPAPIDFPLLDTLTFTCALSAPSAPTPPQYWDEVTILLHDLPELTTLQIKRWNRAISFLPSLSPNLRKLDLSTWVGSGNAALRDDHIHQLAEACPNLQHLTLEVRRSRGNSVEVARYRSLGRIPRLQELYICLDVPLPGHIQMNPDGSATTSRDTAIEPWFDEQDAKYLPWPFEGYREGHIRDVLINSAIDESLARSIFEVIDRAKPTSSPGGVSPLSLERLELRVRGGVELPYHPYAADSTALRRLLDALTREWRVERDVRDDSRGVLHAVNLAQDVTKRVSRLAQSYRVGEDETWESLIPPYESARTRQYWFGLWRRTWPIERESLSWWEDWASRPLDLEANATAHSG